MRLAGKSGQLGPVWLQNVCKKLGCKAQLFCRISSETDRRRNGTRAGGRRTRLTIYGKVNRKKIRWGFMGKSTGKKSVGAQGAPAVGPGGVMCEKRHIWRGRGARKKSAPPAKVERSISAMDTRKGGAPKGAQLSPVRP